MSEKQREKIRQEAKELLEKFANALEKVKLGKGKELKTSERGFREENEGSKCDEVFRKRMFENAPEVNGDCIVAEKKKW